MKQVCITIVMLVSFIISNGQVKTADAGSNDTGKIAKIESTLDQILQKLKKQESESKQFTGEVCLIGNLSVNVYKNKGGQQSITESTQEKVKIKKVTLLIKDGYILDINVYSDKDEQFTNGKAPITISTRRFSLGDSLRSTSLKNRAIILRDFLQYKPNNTFAPEDGFITLDASKKCDSLFRNVGLNSVLDFRVYTDALGLVAKEANGITQSDIRFKQILHRQNIPNRGTFFGHYFRFNLSTAKFDSKLNFTDSANFSRTLSQQKSWLNFEGAYNLMTTWIERKSLSTFYADLGLGINTFNLAKSKDTSTVLTQNVFAEMGLNLKSSDNIGFDLVTRVWVNYSPQTNFNDNNIAKWFWRVGGEVYWNPLNERAGRLFGRVNYLMPLYTSEKKDHFFQIQLGYSILLTKAIKSSKE